MARRLPIRTPPWWQGQIIAIGCVAAGALLRDALDPMTGGHIPIVLFYPCVLLAAVLGGSLAALTATFLGGWIASALWLHGGSQVVTLSAYTLVCLFGIFMAASLRDLAQTHLEGEQRARLLAHELNHRANNLLSVIQAISAQTARTAPDVQSYQEAFETRLGALAKAQHLASEAPDLAVDLSDLVAQVLEPFDRNRFAVDGTPVRLAPGLAPALALLLHELGVNAVKHGALSNLEGRVSLVWRANGRRVELAWREQGGPPVRPPTRRGFGSRLLTMAMRPDQGTVVVDYAPEGVACRLEFESRV